MSTERDGSAASVNYARDKAAADSVAKDIAACGGKALVVQADVTDEASVGRMMAWSNGG
jgi:3-oxoacyl-[acyl-carrier protein] reductase